MLRLAVTGTNFDPSKPSNYFSNFQLVAASSLQTVVMNCFPGVIFRSFSNICGVSRESTYTMHSRRSREARPALVDSLRLGVERRMFPAAKRLWIVQAPPHDNADASIDATLLRRDILRKQTPALPFRNPVGSQRDTFLIRTLEGQEFLSYSWAIEALVENQTWKESREGHRFPATLLAPGSSIYAAKSLPLESTEELKAENPRKSCRLWSNEEARQSRLLHAEMRDGLTDMTQIRERTPAGWHRTGK